MADTEYGQLLKIEQSGGLNPVQQTRKQELERMGQTTLNTDGGSSGGFSSGGDPFATAQKIQNFQTQANAPVITAKEQERTALKDRYSKLIESIKGNQKTAETRQTVATGSELARRGILSDSGVAQQEMTNALNPITSEYTGRIEQASGAQGQEEAAINTAIAQLRAGNPLASLELATGMENSARQNALRQQEIDASLRSAALQNALRKTDIVNVGGRNVLIDTQTGETIKDIGAAGGGSGSDMSSLLALLGMNGGNTNDMDRARREYTDFIVQTYGIDEAMRQGLVGARGYGR